jgi:hypothetical protein
VTTEQAIILAFLAAAFVAGWAARAIVGAVRRPEASPAKAEPKAVVESPLRGGPAHESRHELERAIRAYHAAVVRSRPIGKHDRSDESTLESLAGALVALSRAVDHESRELAARHPLTERLQNTGLELRRLADDVMRHSREQELPAGVFDQLEQNLISAASMIFAPDRLEVRAV